MSNEKSSTGHGNDGRGNRDNNLLYESAKEHGDNAVRLDRRDDEIEYLLHEF